MDSLVPGWMENLRLKLKIRRVGNTLALFLPAKEARRARLHEGQHVEVELRPRPLNPVGMLAHLNLPEFQREDEGNVDRY